MFITLEESFGNHSGKTAFQMALTIDDNWLLLDMDVCVEDQVKEKKRNKNTRLEPKVDRRRTQTNGNRLKSCEQTDKERSLRLEISPRINRSI